MTNERLDFIDFAKGFAILSIVLFHYSQPYAFGLWAKAIMVGGTGVHLFFILSGFGLGLSSTKMESLTFYKKRFSKILIPYYFIILIIYFTNEVFQIYQGNSLYAIGGHLFLYKMFDERIMGSYGYHFWFISTIIQFYVAFPLIVKFKNRTSRISFFLISLLISIVYWVLITVLNVSHLRVCNSFFLQYLWEFNLGILLAERYLKCGEVFWNKRISVLLLYSMLGLGLMGIMVLKGGRLGQTFNDLPASIGYLCLTSASYILISNVQQILSFFIYVGKISYELYLIHMLFFLLANKLILESTNSGSSIFTSLFIVLPISIIAAKGYSFLINIIYRYFKVSLAIKKTKIAHPNAQR